MFAHIHAHTSIHTPLCKHACVCVCLIPQSDCKGPLHQDESHRCSARHFLPFLTEEPHWCGLARPPVSHCVNRLVMGLL